MEFKDLNKDIVVFRYHVSPNFGMEGDDGGFSLELRGNGNLKFAAYRLFDECHKIAGRICGYLLLSGGFRGRRSGEENTISGSKT